MDNNNRGLFEDDVAISYDKPLIMDIYAADKFDNFKPLVGSYSFEKKIDLIKEYLNIPDFYVHTYSRKNMDCVAVDFPKNGIPRQFLTKAMNVCGLFETLRFSIGDLDRIHFEPKS